MSAQCCDLTSIGRFYFSYPINVDVRSCQVVDEHRWLSLSYLELNIYKSHKMDQPDYNHDSLQVDD